MLLLNFPRLVSCCNTHTHIYTFTLNTYTCHCQIVLQYQLQVLLDLLRDYRACTRHEYRCKYSCEMKHQLGIFLEHKQNVQYTRTHLNQSSNVQVTTCTKHIFEIRFCLKQKNIYLRPTILYKQYKQTHGQTRCKN